MNDLPYSFVLGVPAIITVLMVVAYFVFSYMSKKLDEEFPDKE